MDIVVSDTNIFIDLFSVGLLDAFCMLPLNVHTVDYVIYEITDNTQKIEIERLIQNGNIFVKDFDEEESADIIKMYTERRNNVSVTDCSVWYYAKKNRYRLLTGDSKLRNSAVDDGVQVSGILFLTDMMVEKGLIKPDDMAVKLKRLLELNARLPLRLINERIAKYEK